MLHYCKTYEITKPCLHQERSNTCNIWRYFFSFCIAKCHIHGLFWKFRIIIFIALIQSLKWFYGHCTSASWSYAPADYIIVISEAAKSLSYCAVNFSWVWRLGKCQEIKVRKWRLDVLCCCRREWQWRKRWPAACHSSVPLVVVVSPASGTWSVTWPHTWPSNPSAVHTALMLPALKISSSFIFAKCTLALRSPLVLSPSLPEVLYSNPNIIWVFPSQFHCLVLVQLFYWRHNALYR